MKEKCLGKTMSRPLKIEDQFSELEIPKTPLSIILIRLFSTVVILSILLFSIKGAEIRFGDLWTNWDNMVQYGSGFLKPDFIDWPDYLQEMIITLQIAAWGTFLAIIGAIPFGLMCSANLSPVWLSQPVRRMMDLLRSVNEMVFAMLFIAAVGLGPFAGVLALTLHTLGSLSKLFSEVVEAIDPQPVEGIRATGATSIEEIIYGVLPQVFPLWISYSLYRFEANVRSASVIGMVGAGGIGMLLWDAIRSFDYSKTAAIILIIVIVVSFLDFTSARIRRIYI